MPSPAEIRVFHPDWKVELIFPLEKALPREPYHVDQAIYNTLLQATVRNQMEASGVTIRDPRLIIKYVETGVWSRDNQIGRAHV